MNCKKAEEMILTDYIDGNLKDEALREVEEHLAACQYCRDLAVRAVSSRRMLKSAAREVPPEGLWSKIRAEIISEETKPGFFDRIFDQARYFFGHLRPAVAAAAVAAIVIFVLTTARLVPVGSPFSGMTAHDDILEITSVGEESDDSEYGFGTAVEEYFL